MNSMTLIADSGSTKTDWLIGSTVVQTQGINPIHQQDDSILAVLLKELLPQLSTLGSTPSAITTIRFYGSGVRTDQEQRMERLLGSVFTAATSVEARSDMLGAARALCGTSEGMACILGTGANSCLYDGRNIVANTPALGYILGDEGSGAVLGRLFLNAVYKNKLYEGAREEFEQQTGLTMTDVIDRVYRQPMANRWLASLSEYIHSRIGQPSVEQLVIDNFKAFIRNNINPYRRPDLPLNAVGSIAYYYCEQLRQAVQSEGYVLGRVLRNPIEGLRLTT